MDNVVSVLSWESAAQVTQLTHTHTHRQTLSDRDRITQRAATSQSDTASEQLHQNICTQRQKYTNDTTAADCVQPACQRVNNVLTRDAVSFSQLLQCSKDHTQTDASIVVHSWHVTRGQRRTAFRDINKQLIALSANTFNTHRHRHRDIETDRQT